MLVYVNEPNNSVYAMRHDDSYGIFAYVHLRK